MRQISVDLLVDGVGKNKKKELSKQPLYNLYSVSCLDCGCLIVWMYDVLHGLPECEGMDRGIFTKLQSGNLQKFLNQPLELTTGDHLSTLTNNACHKWSFQRVKDLPIQQFVVIIQIHRGI